MMRIHLAGLCFTQAQGIPVRHEIGLVALSYRIAAAGSFAALEMVERWRQASETKASAWKIASAVILGGSIWSMHLVAMLALDINLHMTYSVGPTLLPCCSQSAQ
jgi:NO-binding membrane sensor protein with MHYT domain